MVVDWPYFVPFSARRAFSQWGVANWRKALSALAAKGNLMFYNDEITFLSVELKYCERCGSLYVRRSDSEAKLCLPCIDAERMVETLFFATGKDLRAQAWTGSVNAVLAGARHWSGTDERNGWTV